MDEFDSVCTCRRLKVNAGNSKVSEMREVEVVNLSIFDMVRVLEGEECQL